MKIIKLLIITVFLLLAIFALYFKLTIEPVTHTCIADSSKTLSLHLTKYNPFSKFLNEFDGKLELEFSSSKRVKFEYKEQKQNKFEFYKKDSNISQGYYSSKDNSFLINIDNKTIKAQCSICKEYCVNNILH